MSLDMFPMQDIIGPGLIINVTFTAPDQLTLTYSDNTTTVLTVIFLDPL
jgi:hypothetical protein